MSETAVLDKDKDTVVASVKRITWPDAGKDGFPKVVLKVALGKAFEVSMFNIPAQQMGVGQVHKFQLNETRSDGLYATPIAP